MKKISVFLILLVSVFLISGCDNKEENTKVTVGGEEVSTEEMAHKHCTRNATADGDIEVSLNYDLYYTGDKLNLLKSEEKVMSANEESLTIYEEAYKGIHKHYEGLKYYDVQVVRGDTTVTSTTTIDYDKIDIQKLIDIEGEEDNIFEDGEAKVSKWLTLAKKLGATCKDEESEA